MHQSYGQPPWWRYRFHLVAAGLWLGYLLGLAKLFHWF